MDRLIQFAAMYRVHVHLVAHSKKPSKGGEAMIPRRYDIMGSSYISNLPHNVIVVWRNRAKHDALSVVFQECERWWQANRAGEKMPPWPRLQGGPPSKEREDLLVIWRRMVDVIEQLPQDMQESFLAQVQEHDAYFIVDAQRGGDGDTPVRHLWFHVDSLQFIEESPWKKGANKKLCRPRAYTQTEAVPVEETQASDLDGGPLL